eukprot:g70930.t1
MMPSTSPTMDILLPSTAFAWDACLLRMSSGQKRMQLWCHFEFSKHKLMPMGSFSKISPVDDPSSACELYGSNDLSLGRLFWYRRFDP